MMKNHKSSAFLYFPHNFTEDIINYTGENRINYNLSSSVYVHYAKDSEWNFL